MSDTDNIEESYPGLVDPGEQLPRDGEVVIAVPPWGGSHRVRFGKKDGRPVWYRLEGRTRTMPAVLGWKPLEEL